MICVRVAAPRRGSLPPAVRPALRPLLPLPELSAPDRERVRHQPTDRDRPGGAPRRRPGPGRRGSQRREEAEDLALPTCQIAVYSQYTSARMRFVRGGTLDDPASVAPDVHIFTRSKLPWVEIPESVPAFNVYYDTKKLWPAASLERLEALTTQRRSLPDVHRLTKAQARRIAVRGQIPTPVSQLSAGRARWLFLHGFHVVFSLTSRLHSRCAPRSHA